jgi:hypothetical protein
LFQRVAGLVDVTDREVWMLYSSFTRSLGPALIWSYGPRRKPSQSAAPAAAPTSPGSPRSPRSAGTASRATCALPTGSATSCTFTASRAAWNTVSLSGWAPSTGTRRWNRPPRRGRRDRCAACSPAALWTAAHPGLVLSGGLLTVRLWARAHHR